MGYEPPDYEHPTHGMRWTAGVGEPAGLFYFSGRCMIAAHGSAAEAWLLGQGAILFATLSFGPDPLEASHAGRAFRRLRPQQVLEALRRAAVNPECGQGAARTPARRCRTEDRLPG